MDQDPDYQIYANLLSCLGKGLAVWEPTPINYDKVRVGDVGYMRYGCFHRLFNVLLPEDHNVNINNVPPDFVRLELGLPSELEMWRSPRVGPTTLQSSDIIVKGIGAGVSASSSVITSGGSIQFESTASSGAILLTPNKTYRADAAKIPRIEKYGRLYVESWLQLAIDGDFGPTSLEDIMLITGYDVTSKYAMAAFSNSNRSLSFEFQAGLPMATTSISVWGSWQNTASVYHNCGPQIREPPSHQFGRSDSSPESLSGASLANQTNDDTPLHRENDYVFLRRIRFKKRLMMAPTRIRAAAGPNNLPSSQDEDQLTSVMIDDTESADEKSGDELIILTDTPQLKDPLDYVFEYIFENSNAQFAVASDMDFLPIIKCAHYNHSETSITQDGLTTDMSLLLKHHAPIIDIGTDGLARIKPVLDKKIPLRCQVDLPYHISQTGYEDLAMLAFIPELEMEAEILFSLMEYFSDPMSETGDDDSPMPIFASDGLALLKENIHTWSSWGTKLSSEQLTTIREEVKLWQKMRTSILQQSKIVSGERGGGSDGRSSQSQTHRPSGSMPSPSNNSNDNISKFQQAGTRGRNRLFSNNSKGKEDSKRHAREPTWEDSFVAREAPPMKPLIAAMPPLPHLTRSPWHVGQQTSFAQRQTKPLALQKTGSLGEGNVNASGNTTGITRATPASALRLSPSQTRRPSGSMSSASNNGKNSSITSTGDAFDSLTLDSLFAESRRSPSESSEPASTELHVEDLGILD